MRGPVSSLSQFHPWHRGLKTPTTQPLHGLQAKEANLSKSVISPPLWFLKVFRTKRQERPNGKQEDLIFIYTLAQLINPKDGFQLLYIWSNELVFYIDFMDRQNENKDSLSSYDSFCILVAMCKYNRVLWEQEVIKFYRDRNFKSRNSHYSPVNFMS